MAKWYNTVSQNLSKLPDCIDYFEDQLEEARVETGMKGNIEKNASNVPGIVEHRFNQLQEIEAILEFLNIKLRQVKSKYYRTYLENYQRALTSNDVKNYIEGEQEVVDTSNLVNEFAFFQYIFI